MIVCPSCKNVNSPKRVLDTHTTDTHSLGSTSAHEAALHKISFSRPSSSRGYELQFQKPFRVFMGYLRQIVRADWCDVQHLAAFGVGGEGIVDREQHTVGAEDL